MIQLRFVIQDGKRILQSRMTMLPTRNAAGDIVLYVPDTPEPWADVELVDGQEEMRAAANANRSGVSEAMIRRAYEVVHHDADCPAIGGNGDRDCACDAVPFLRDLTSALATERARYAELVAVLRLWVKYDATAEDDGPTLENDYTAAITATCAALAALGPQS